MPIPTKWKLVAGSVTAVVGISTAAAALSGSDPAPLDLDEAGSVTAVVDTPAVEFSIAVPNFAAADADESLSTPFDGPDDSPHDYVDTDRDGITDIAEMELGISDYKLEDTDFDGFSDYEEIAIYGTDPDDASSVPPDPVQVDDSPHSPDTPDSSDSSGSSDSSDSSNSPDSSDTSDSPDHVDIPKIEYPDDDGDGLSNAAEAALNARNLFDRDLKPDDPDLDDDLLSDGEEVLRYGTDPTKSDTDGDTFSDYDEIAAGSDPLDAGSVPSLDETPNSNDSGD